MWCPVLNCATTGIAMLSTATLGALCCPPTSGVVAHKTQRIWGGVGVSGVLGCNSGVAAVRCRLDPVCAAPIGAP